MLFCFKKLYFKYITEKDFKKARLGDQECIFELQRQKNYLQDIVTSLEKELKVSKYVNYGEGMNYMEVCINITINYLSFFFFVSCI